MREVLSPKLYCSGELFDAERILGELDVSFASIERMEYPLTCSINVGRAWPMCF